MGRSSSPPRARLLLAALPLLAACAGVRPRPSQQPELRIALAHVAPERFVARSAVFRRARRGVYTPDDVYAGFVQAGAEAGLVEAIRAQVEGRKDAPGWEELLERAGLAPRVQAGTAEELERVRREACGAPEACPEARWVVLEGLR